MSKIIKSRFGVKQSGGLLELLWDSKELEGLNWFGNLKALIWYKIKSRGLLEIIWDSYELWGSKWDSLTLKLWFCVQKSKSLMEIFENPSSFKRQNGIWNSMELQRGGDVWDSFAVTSVLQKKQSISCYILQTIFNVQNY